MDKVLFRGIELSWDDYYWLGESCQPSEIEIHINSKDEQPQSPHNLQIHAWDEFLNNYDSILSSILNEILKYYIRMRPRYLEAGSEWVENMPEINNTKEIEKIITLNYITINWPYDEMRVQIGLSYSCTWEREHGLGVVLENNIVKEVGGADCAII